MREYRVVTRAEDLGAIANQIQSAGVVGLDIETYKDTGGGALDPRHGHIRLLQLNIDDVSIYVIDAMQTGTLDSIVAALASTKAVLVIHNAKFEQKWFWHKYKLELWPIFCTFRASALLYNGKKFSHDLWSLYERELQIKQETVDLGGSDWSKPNLTREQYDYAAEDVINLLRLRKILRAKLMQMDLVRTAVIEFGVALPEGVVELNGMPVDRSYWRAQMAADAIQATRLHSELLFTLPHPTGQMALPGFDGGWNIDSQQQMLVSLNKMGIKIPDTKKLTMGMLAGKYPIINKVIEYRKYAKRGTSFGDDWLRWVAPDERIHGDYYSLLAAGRYSCCAAWTPVRTFGGTKRLDEVRPGDRVWTHRNRWRRVTAFLPQGRRQIFDVRLSTGDVLTCTGDHKVLLASGEWITVQELANERFARVGFRAEESDCGAGAVPEFRAAAHVRYRGGARNYVSQRAARHTRVLARGRAAGFSCASVLGLQGGVEESDARQTRGSAPQLEGAVRGRVRLLDLSVERKASVCSSRGDDASAGAFGATGHAGRTSHRQRSDEQRLGQPCVGNDSRTSRYPQLAGKGQSVVTVEEIHVGGSIEVYDLTVDEDESYETCGIFSHNCSKPNLQQVPRDAGFRNCFRAQPGKVFVLADYSGIEMRIVAEISGDPRLCKVFQDGRDAHYATASLIMGKTKDQITKSERQMAKPVNFGFIYGMMPAKLVLYALGNYGVPMTEKQATTFRTKYFSREEGYYGIKLWHDRELRDIKRSLISRTMSGRLRYLEEDAHNEILNTPVQGTGADGLKIALREMHNRIQKFGSSGEIIHHVHDEIILQVDNDPEVVAAAKAELNAAMHKGMEPFLKTVPCEVEASVGPSWGEAKAA